MICLQFKNREIMKKPKKVEEINISSIKDFPNHPFKVINDEKNARNG